MIDDLLILVAFALTIAFGVAVFAGDDAVAAATAAGLALCALVRLARVVAQAFSPRY